MHFLQSSSGHTPLENAIVLLRIYVQRFFIDGRIVLYLVYGVVWFTLILVRLFLDWMLLLLRYIETVRRCRDGGWCRGRVRRRLSGDRMLLLLLGWEELVQWLLRMS